MQVQMPPGRLQLVLQPTGEEVFEPGAVTQVPLIRFAAYVANQRVFGWVRLDADRLTDLLNAHDELHLIDVEPRGPPKRMAQERSRSSFVSVTSSYPATGPRGDAGRWQAT
jgi:hypothetical protein